MAADQQSVNEFFSCPELGHKFSSWPGPNIGDRNVHIPLIAPLMDIRRKNLLEGAQKYRSETEPCTARSTVPG